MVGEVPITWRSTPSTHGRLVDNSPALLGNLLPNLAVEVGQVPAGLVEDERDRERQIFVPAGVGILNRRVKELGGSLADERLVGHSCWWRWTSYDTTSPSGRGSSSDDGTRVPGGSGTPSLARVCLAHRRSVQNSHL